MCSKVVILAGFGGSGKTAVLDLLREVENIYVAEEELRIISDPDGLLSLKSALVDNWTPYQGDLAIKRYIDLCAYLQNKYSKHYFKWTNDVILGKSFSENTNEFINALAPEAYRGLWLRMRTFRTSLKRKLFKKTPLRTLYKKKIYITNPLALNEFMKLSCKYLESLTFSLQKEKTGKLIVYDEPYASMNLEHVINLFPEGKIIVVTRDPRAIYSEIYKKEKLDFIPHEVAQFIEYQKSVMLRWNNQKETLPLDKVLDVKFEKLISEYQITINKIFSFLNILPSTHKWKNKYLDPHKSQKNVAKWQRILPAEIANNIYHKLKHHYKFNS
jgi:hypothetical protein